MNKRTGAIRSLLLSFTDRHQSQSLTFQRFDGALNLNIHFHMMFLDAVGSLARLEYAGQRHLAADR